MILLRTGLILAVLVAALSAAPGAGPAWAQQDPTYAIRFAEELTRKVPPVIIPSPSPAEFAAAPPTAALPIPMAEAKTIMGLDQLGPDVAARLPGGKLGIVDLGFDGLKAWLANHPDEARLTTYINRATNQPDPAISDPQPTDHGYWVYRVTRQILPDVPIYLYQGGQTAADVTGALLDGSVRGVVVFNMSLGANGLCQIVAPMEEEFAKDLRLALVQRESFLFISEGNGRDTTHTWQSADLNENGYVDFRTAAEAAKSAGSSIDSARVSLSKGDNTATFSWDAKTHPDADYAVELVTPQGVVLGSVRRDPQYDAGQCLTLSYKADKDMPATLRVKWLAGPKRGVLMRLGAYGIGDSADFNGLQTAAAYTFRDDPFVIFNGSFGKTPDGKLKPSAFSDLGHAADGSVAPHVLGPGQLILDGKTLEGTSFSSPFLTALYATRVGYNLKNLVERTASFDRLAPGVAPFERSRWGIPDPRKVTATLRTITGPTTVEQVSHVVEGDHMVLRYSISRCCMQSLVWTSIVGFIDPETGAVLKDPQGQNLMFGRVLRTEESTRVSYPIEIRMPMSEFAGLKGKTVRLAFGLRVRAWQNPPPGSLTVDDAPAYQITF